MENETNDDLSLGRSMNPLGGEDGYDIWFDLPSREGDATTTELQTLCQGSILVGRIAEAMGWDWPTLIRNVDHVSAPLDGFLLLEVNARVFASERFRQAVATSVPNAGLDPYKVKIVDAENANVYVLGHGLPVL